ncbi:probable disease resistance protein [Tanacetum coccineum]|uniref:Probable disease resistance protein n=1 Tax=Tanacetum coccineum TaxID=301880 RepID=A0ABQ4XAI5_9ASTR
MCLLMQIVKLCKGLPLALTVVGASLCGQSLLKWKTTLKKWLEGQSILQSNTSMLFSLKSSIDELDELPIIKECFLDMGLFPEDERTAATTITDIWADLYNFDDKGMYTCELQGYCNELNATQHDLLRVLAIYLSSQEPVEERKRLFIEIFRNKFPTWWTGQITQPLNALIISILTDEGFDSMWASTNSEMPLVGAWKDDVYMYSAHTALERICNDLLKIVLQHIGMIHARKFQKQLKCLEKTLQSVVFCEIWRSSEVLDRPQKEITACIVHMNKGKELLLKCSRVQDLNTNQKFLHLYKLYQLNNELLRFFKVDMDIKKTSTSMRSLSGVSDLAYRMDQQLSIQGKSLFIEKLAQPTDEAFNSICYDLTAPKGDDLTLNIQSRPHSIERMDQQRDYPSQLHNNPSIGYLSSLKTIIFEHVSVSSIQPIFTLHNLQKLSFVMCEISDVFMSCDSKYPNILPRLTELEFDGCYDLKELPSGICSLVNLRTLSITNCHELDGLPKALGNLLHLENLSLRCCTKLQELPQSIGSLRNLTSIDISDCLSISVLPEEIGELSCLRVLKMSGCRGLQKLPGSMSNLCQLKDVTCDEETSYLWMNFESDLYDLKINVVEDNRIESFMKIIR